MENLIFEMRALLAVVALTVTLAASEAAAQGANGYDCRGFGSCGKPTDKDAKAQVRAVKRERPAPPRKARPLSQQGLGEPTNPDWRRRLGDAILEGRCEDARRIALEFGSVDMAVKSVRLCRPGPWLPLS